MKSQRSKSKNKRHSKSKARINNEQDFYENILDINIKKPGGSFVYFVKEMMQKHNIKLTDASQSYKSKWEKMSEKEKEKYELIVEEETKRYNEHLALVKKYLVDVDQLKEEVSPYMMFKRAYVSHAINNQDRDAKDARKEAKGAWDELNSKEKQKWEDEFNKNKDLQEELRTFKPGKLNAYSLFVRDKVSGGLKFVEAAKKWEKIDDKTKKKYEDYADLENKEKKKKVILWQISTGIKPRRPVGAFRFFYKEIKEQGKLKNVKNPVVEAADMYKKLKDEDKEKYEKLNKQEQLEYQIKLSEYKKFINNKLGKAPSAYNIYMADKSKDFDDDEEELEPGELFKLIHKKWKGEPKSVIEKYEKKAEDIKKEYDEYKKQKLDLKKPKNPKSAWTLFYAENYESFAKKNPGLMTKEIMKKLAEKWNDTSPSDKEPYEKRADKDKLRYQKEIEEFEQDNEIRGRTKNTQRFFVDHRRSKSKGSAYSQNLQSQEIKEKSQRSKSKTKNKTRSKRKRDSDDKSVKSKKSDKSKKTDKSKNKKSKNDNKKSSSNDRDDKKSQRSQSKKSQKKK